MSVGDLYYEERTDIDRVVKDSVEKIYDFLRQRGDPHPETGLLRDPIEEWFRLIVFEGEFLPRNMIYFIADGSLESGTTGIKIGKTTDIDKRIGMLQVGNKAKLKVVAMLPQCTDYEIGEKYIHRFFKRDRIRGEWFRSSPSLKVFINTVNSVCKNLKTYRHIHIE